MRKIALLMAALLGAAGGAVAEVKFDLKDAYGGMVLQPSYICKCVIASLRGSVVSAGLETVIQDPAKYPAGKSPYPEGMKKDFVSNGVAMSNFCANPLPVMFVGSGGNGGYSWAPYPADK